MAKKLLSTILKERTESIKYRAIKKILMGIAQNEKKECLILVHKLDNYALTTLQNEGITVKKVDDFGHKKYKLTW